jgi:hypothetical protein
MSVPGDRQHPPQLFARRKSFYRGFLIAVPAFLLAVEILVCRYVLLRKTPGSISRTVCLGAVKI